MIGAPFTAMGQTFAITVTATSSTAVQATGNQASDYLLTNVGTQVVWASYSQAASIGAVVIPVPGTPQAAIPIQANSSRVISAGPNSYFVTIAASTGSTLFITPGDGN
jgi:hypothetical protein